MIRSRTVWALFVLGLAVAGLVVIVNALPGWITKQVENRFRASGATEVSVGHVAVEGYWPFRISVDRVNAAYASSRQNYRLEAKEIDAAFESPRLVLQGGLQSNPTIEVGHLHLVVGEHEKIESNSGKSLLPQVRRGISALLGQQIHVSVERLDVELAWSSAWSGALSVEWRDDYVAFNFGGGDLLVSFADITIDPAAGEVFASGLLESRFLQFSGKVLATGETLRLVDLRGTGGAWLRSTSQISLNTDAEPMLVTVDSSISLLDISPQLDSTLEVPRERLFSDVPLGYAWLSRADVQAVVNIQSVVFGDQHLAQGIVRITSKDNDLEVVGDDLAVMGGEGEFRMIGSLGDSPSFLMQAAVDGADLNQLVSDPTDSRLTKGPLDGLLQLSFSGNNLQEHAATSTGTLRVGMRDAMLDHDVARWADTAVVAWTGEKLGALWQRVMDRDLAEPESDNPVDQLHLSCVSVDARLDSGHLAVHDGFLIETDNNLVLSSGYADLATERIAFTFRTRRKRFFDWSAMSSIKYAELRGTLMAPDLSLNPVQTAKRGAMAAASLVWGPVPPFVVELISSTAANAQEKPKCVAELVSLGAHGTEEQAP